MFICQSCNKIIGPRVSPIIKVVETREKVYPNMPREDGTVEYGGVGWEIVKEIKLCSKCK